MGTVVSDRTALSEIVVQTSSLRPDAFGALTPTYGPDAVVSCRLHLWGYGISDQLIWSTPRVRSSAWMSFFFLWIPVISE